VSVQGRVSTDEVVEPSMRIVREPIGSEINVASPTHIQFSQRVTDVPLPAGLPTPDEIYDELQGYTDVLLGRVPSPVNSPYLALAEVATAYFARGQELDMLIHEAERSGDVTKNAPHYKIRTGALRSFLEMSKKMADLGSRRLTQEQLLYEARHDAGEL
jgi:hypothetical protein